MPHVLKSFIAALALGCAVIAPATAQTSPEEKREIERIVRDYLLTNPDIVEKALMTLQANRDAEAKMRASLAIEQMSDKLLNSRHQAVLGNPEGRITLVEFFDYNCAYCRRALNDMTALMEANPDLKMVMKEFPILNEGSVEAARVSVAIKDLAPQSYLQFHEELLTRPGTADGEKALSIAEELGLDVEALKAAANSKDVTDNFIEVQGLAQALGISGTPSYVIGGEVVPGAAGFDALQAKVAAVRTCGSATC